MKKILYMVVLLFSFTLVFSACNYNFPATGSDEDKEESNKPEPPVQKYNLTVKREGLVLITLPLKYEEIISNLPTNLVKIGYDFDGYYIENAKISNGDRFNFKNDVTAIAKFSEIIFKINLNSETGNSTINYTINSNNITLPVLEKAGFTFIGWFENSDYSGEVITHILSSNLKNYSLYAKFEQNPPEITYTKIVLDLSCSFNAYMLFDELGFKTDGYTVEFNVSNKETLGSILYQKSQSLGLNLILYLNNNYEINNIYPFEILSNENFSFKQLLNEQGFSQNSIYLMLLDI